MSMHNFQKETVIKASQERVFAFHELPDAFEKLIPPWETARIIQKADITKVGSQAVIEQKLFGLFSQKWVAEHTKYEPPRMFEDVQVSGPFKYWVHRHIVEPRGEHAVLKDEIEFDPGFSILGDIGAPLVIYPKLRKMFDYRHKVTKEWAEG